MQRLHPLHHRYPASSWTPTFLRVTPQTPFLACCHSLQSYFFLNFWLIQYLQISGISVLLLVSFSNLSSSHLGPHSHDHTLDPTIQRLQPCHNLWSLLFTAFSQPKGLQSCHLWTIPNFHITTLLSLLK